MRQLKLSIRGPAGAFCGRHPLFTAAVVAAGCVLLAEGSPAARLVAGMVLGLACVVLKNWRTGLAWLF